MRNITFVQTIEGYLFYMNRKLQVNRFTSFGDITLINLKNVISRKILKIFGVQRLRYTASLSKSYKIANISNCIAILARKYLQNIKTRF